MADARLKPVGGGSGERETAQRADRSGGGKRREVAPVHLVAERALAHLVQAGELKVHPASIGQKQPVEGDGEAALVPILNGLGRSDDARPARDQRPLAVGRIERRRHYREHWAGELARELSKEHRFEERALVDALPARRVVRPHQTAGLGGAGGDRNIRLLYRASDTGCVLSGGQPGRHLGLKGGEGLPERGERAIERRIVRLGHRARRGRVRGSVRIPVRLGDGE